MGLITMKGKFITLEGCEGVGKSTQLKKLERFFAEKGISAVFTREPGGTAISEKIRSVILDKDNTEMDDVTELMLYVAARRQHVAQKIKPAIKCGNIVVCDRFTDSTLAYQGYARGLDTDLIRRLNDIALGDVNIDLTLFFDYPPEKAFARKGGADSDDRMENQKLSFHRKVYEGYCDIANAEQNRIAVIDASLSEDEVFASVIEKLKEKGII